MNHDEIAAQQEKALDALRETVAPLGSRWLDRFGHEWRLVHRERETVVLKRTGVDFAKSGPLHLLTTYRRVTGASHPTTEGPQ